MATTKREGVTVIKGPGREIIVRLAIRTVLALPGHSGLEPAI